MGSETKKEEISVYVIDRDFRLVHFNDVLKKLFPDLQAGLFCYQALCGEKKKCDFCPIRMGEQKGSIFLNKILQKWINVKVGEIDWPGHGICKIIIANTVEDQNNLLLYSMTRFSYYDDLLEMNLTQDTYRVLSHEKGKYLLPEEKECLSLMLKEASQRLIFPEDREAHGEFWNLDTLWERLQKSETPGVLRGIFREKLQNGEWCRIQHLIVAVKTGMSEDRIAMCFVSELFERNEGVPVPTEMALAEKRERHRLTGLYEESAFVKYARLYLEANAGRECCLITIDIERFKLFNEWYGREEGDKFLVAVAQMLKKMEERLHGIAGYYGADNFVMMMPFRKDWIYELQNAITVQAEQFGDNAGFLPAFGVYVIRNRSLSLDTMYDRAVIALSFAKGNYSSRIIYYSNSMIERMEEEQNLLIKAQKAIQRREFVFYLQPQCDIGTGKILSAEALIRWNTREKGIISPGVFLPVLEKNGFIVNLDQYVWEEVCVWLRRWIDEGHRPVPVSVNVSQVDLCSFDVTAYFISLIRKYRLPSGLLKIEITESAYVEQFEVVTKAVGELRKAGFVVMMDDFGSGASSLNMLKNVNVDVLKIDMRFLDINSENRGKGFSILKSVLNMARLLQLPIIVEGVENTDQIDFLRNMECRYVQGYYFYRPMPVKQFEELLLDENNLNYDGFCNNADEPKNAPEKFCGFIKVKQREKTDDLENHIHDICNSLSESIFLCRLVQEHLELEILADGIPFLYEDNMEIALSEDNLLQEQILYEKMREYIMRLENFNTVFSIELRKHDVRSIDVRGVLIQNDENAPEYLCTCRDVTREETVNRELRRMAETDALTGLYNRHRLIPEISSHLECRSREKGKVIVIDIDHLKETNDSYGHVYGDSLIRAFANRIRDVFGNVLAGRIGGDEFMVFCNIAEKDLETKLNELVQPLILRFEEEERIHTVSVGYSGYPEDGTELKELYRKADRAMYNAKRSGRGTWRKFQKEME